MRIENKTFCYDFFFNLSIKILLFQFLELYSFEKKYNFSKKKRER